MKRQFLIGGIIIGCLVLVGLRLILGREPKPEQNPSALASAALERLESASMVSVQTAVDPKKMPGVQAADPQGSLPSSKNGSAVFSRESLEGVPPEEMTPGQKRKQIRRYHREGRTAMRKDRYPEALDLFQSAERLDPSNHETFRLMQRLFERMHEEDMKKRERTFKGRQGQIEQREAVSVPPTSNFAAGSVSGSPKPPASAERNFSPRTPVPLPELAESQTQEEMDPDSIQEGGEYSVQPEDVLRITVFEEPDLTTQARVSRTGEITMPLLGRVQVVDLTITQLEGKLTKLLEADYLVQPQVQVFIDTPRQVFVTGEVNLPGSYPISTERQSTVLEMIAKAGGFTEDANWNGTRIVRKKNNKEDVIKIRVSDIVWKGDKSQDKAVHPDDIIFVPESFF